ncbi:hypothetical protein [Paenibacillus aestuarii]|uniref:Uncharacterized protein n=1 Tax=Paenibacillus aestuarii TaxID=516965 RepID=A0ABW0KGJ1_9BACL|nr:hypothetical protein [Paenibacillus aestuarii]
MFIIFFIFAGGLLVVDQKLVQADTIIIVGGGVGERALNKP